MKIFVMVIALLTVDLALGASQKLDALTGKPFMVDASRPPNGTQIMQILIENASVPASETSCGKDDFNQSARKVSDLLASFFNGMDDKRYRMVVAADCVTGEWSSQGKATDVWSCRLSRTFTTKKGTHVGVIYLSFDITKDDWKLIPERFFCS